ncbi:predicted protein [Naegleria gruberi]|uniref:Predicted protein n=1 Tax=Naegleria gruberi TaxID=5762 RepID=D2VZV9_NAEGR|nr:uncharacterized protein NAEGRDRAFT_74635 [Naegleria gruberi]EFC37597.1 predicted protein [Naegleria gruberi]|eukprot:XP_002670341.1 predicted protein [Naegleria gruberi strain NEG-M]
MDEDVEWFLSLQKLGFSNEQIVDMWKEKNKEAISENQNKQKKRKIELCLHSCEEEQIGHKFNFLSDEAIGVVFAFVNENFCAFRLMLVSKQFERVVVSSIKILNLNKKAIPKIPQLINSNLCEPIERLIVHTELEHSLLQQLVHKCVNIKHLTASIRKPPFNISFTSPTIQEINIIDVRETKPKVHFASENLEYYPQPQIPNPQPKPLIRTDLSESKILLIKKFVDNTILKDCNLANEENKARILRCMMTIPNELDETEETFLIHEERVGNELHQIYFNFKYSNCKWTKILQKEHMI